MRSECGRRRACHIESEALIRDLLNDLERHARGMLAPDERLLAATRATTLGLFGGQLGAVGAVAVGALVQLAVMSRAAKRARQRGFPAAPYMVIGLTDRRVLVWSASHVSNRAGALLGEVPLQRLTGISVEERIGQGFITFNLRATPPVTVAAFKQDQPRRIAEEFRALANVAAEEPSMIVLPERELVGAAVGAGPQASSSALPAIPPPPPGDGAGASGGSGHELGSSVATEAPDTDVTPASPGLPEGEGKACPQCGTRSSDTASFCWSCYAMFPRADDPAGPASSMGALSGGQMAPPSEMGPGTMGGGASGHLGDPMSGQVTGRLGYQPLPPSTVSKSGSMSTATKVVAAVVGLALMFATISYISSRKHATELVVPESIAGAHRLTSPQLDQIAQQLESAGQAYGVTGQAAYYGISNIPTFFFVAYGYHAKPSETPDAVFTEFSNGWTAAAGGAELVMQSKDTQTAGGTTTICVRVRGETRGSLCMWQDPDVIGFVMALHQNVTFTRTLTTSVQLAVEP